MKIIKPFRLIAILPMLAAIFSCQTVTTESITVEVPTVETRKTRRFRSPCEIAC